MKIFIFMCCFITIAALLLFYILLIRPTKKEELENFLQAKEKAKQEYNEISEKIK